MVLSKGETLTPLKVGWSQHPGPVIGPIGKGVKIPLCVGLIFNVWLV